MQLFLPRTKMCGEKIGPSVIFDTSLECPCSWGRLAGQNAAFLISAAR